MKQKEFEEWLDVEFELLKKKVKNMDKDKKNKQN